MPLEDLGALDVALRKHGPALTPVPRVPDPSSLLAVLADVTRRGGQHNGLAADLGGHFRGGSERCEAVVSSELSSWDVDVPASPREGCWREPTRGAGVPSTGNYRRPSCLGRRLDEGVVAGYSLWRVLYQVPSARTASFQRCESAR